MQWIILQTEKSSSLAIVFYNPLKPIAHLFYTIYYRFVSNVFMLGLLFQ